MESRSTKIFIPSFLPLIILFSAIVVFILNCRDNLFLQDDIYTVFRYIKKFFGGEGLVFNSGEFTEGYTSILWLMILSFAKLLGFSLELSAQYLSVFFGICSLAASAFLYRFIIDGFDHRDEGEKQRSAWFAAIPAVMLAFSTPVIYWSASGMETSLFTFLILLSIIFFLKGKERTEPNYAFAVISLLSILTRPEGFLVFLIILFYEYISPGRGENSGFNIFRNPGRNFKIESAIVLIPLLIYILFRLAYYGYPLPNTYYAKSERSVKFIFRGAGYTLDFLKSYPFFAIALISPLWLLKSGRGNSALRLIYLVITIYSVAVIFIGGDVLPVHRFFLPVFPLIYILFVESVRRLFYSPLSGKNQTALTVVSVLLILSLSILNYYRNEGTMKIKESYESGLVAKMKEYADFINGQDHGGKSIPVAAASTIGALSYFADADVIDIVGLTDEYIAHNPKESEGIENYLPVLWKERHYNTGYIMQRSPDYIIFPAGAKPSAFAECAIFSHPEFVKNYYTQIFYSEKLNQMLPVFTNRRMAGVVPTELNATHKCNPVFLVSYINSADELLKMISEGDRSYLKNILAACDSVLEECPGHASDAEAMKGMAFYHAGEFEDAEFHFSSSLESDSLNSISLFYLKNLFLLREDTAAAASVLLKLMKYSPGAAGNLINKF